MNDRYISELTPFNSGNMGLIFNGYDTNEKRDVCIKVIKKTLADSSEYRRRFKREAMLMRDQGGHENIVKFYDFGINGDVWIAMERLNGLTLDRHKLFSVEEAIALLSQISRAIEHIHSLNIAHCDIKPENIIKESDRYVLIDFGLGFREGGGEETERTAVRSTGGTPVFAPPEQTIGHPRFASDVYSLGCTIYKILTGNFPFNKETALALYEAHATHVRPYASHAREDCPSWLSDLIAHCMDPDPECRPKASEILSTISTHETQTYSQISIFLDDKLSNIDAVIGAISVRYRIVSSEKFADVVISTTPENLIGKKNLYVIDADASDEIFEAAVKKANTTTLIGPVPIHELIAAIES